MRNNFNINKFFQKYNFKRTRKYDEHIINGYYAKNLQIVFVRNIRKDNLKLEEIIFIGVDLFKEILVLGYILKNNTVKDGVISNKSFSIPLLNLSTESFEKAFKKFEIKI